MQSDVLNEPQHSTNDHESTSTSLTTNPPVAPPPTTTTLIYSGLKLHPKPLVPTISMPGVANSLSIVKKLPIPETHLDPSSTSIRNSTPSSIRLVTPTTGKSSPPHPSKAFFLNPSNGTKTSSHHSTPTTTPLLTLIPPGTTSPKIQTLNSLTIATATSTHDFNANASSTPTDLSLKTSTLTNSNPSVFLGKNRLTLITNPSSTSSTTSNSNALPSKFLIQPTTNCSTPNSTFWSQSNSTTKIFSIPSQSPATTTTSHPAKVLSRPVQLIPTSLSSSEHSHLTHLQTIKTDKHENLYPLNMHLGLSSSATHENSSSLKSENSTPATFIHMQFLSSTSDSSNSSHSVQLNLPATSTTTPTYLRSTMDHNNNHQTITTPIIREMNIEEKLSESSTMKTSPKHRTRLPLQPSAQQLSAASSSTSLPSTSQLVRTTKKHKLNEPDPTEPPTKIPHYEQFDAKSRSKPLGKFAVENTTPSSSSSSSTDSNGVAKKKTSNELNFARKRRLSNKIHSNGLSNENPRQTSTNDPIDPQIDDELLQRLSQDFVYVDPQTGIRWIGRKARAKSLTSLVSRFSWKPKINHYEKYSDIIRSNPKRTVPNPNFDSIKKKFDQPFSSWRIDRLTSSITDLTHDEQCREKDLSDILPLLNIDDQTLRTTIEDLIQANLLRHRSLSEQFQQISDVLIQMLDHGNTLRDLCSISKSSSNGKRTKEQR